MGKSNMLWEGGPENSKRTVGMLSQNAGLSRVIRATSRYRR
jgi:hypothetical protein